MGASQCTTLWSWLQREREAQNLPYNSYYLPTISCSDHGGLMFTDVSIWMLGIVIEKKCEEAFSSRLDQLSSVLKVRTSVYAVEEKALKVMIEGEHEEEKRREREKQMKKEKEKLMLTKRMMDAVLFGGTV